MRAAYGERVETLLIDSFRRGIKRDRLRVTFASGNVMTFGNAARELVAIRFTDRAAELAFALDPSLKLGELYADGRLILEQGELYDLITLFKRGARRGATLPALALEAGRHAASYGRARLSPARSERNVAHHYNLDERLYRLFLDEDMMYSCAYFERPDQSLDGAQLAKKRHIAGKLLLEPDQRVLDIGSGWGGMALYLAEIAGVDVTGVTLSRPQLEVAEARARERDLSSRAHFELRDYRHVSRTFDRIVSIGMFEHVGIRNYDLFFSTCARVLEKRGVMVLHSIGRTKPRPVPSPFIDKYIFPGSYIPALSEVLPAVERAGFLVTDLETLPLHYADTLHAWKTRLLNRKREVVALYDERFLRLWEFYLASSEAAFRMDRMFVFQLQLTRPQTVVPNRRDYLTQHKARLRSRELSSRHYKHLD